MKGEQLSVDYLSGGTYKLLFLVFHTDKLLHESIHGPVWIMHMDNGHGHGTFTERICPSSPTNKFSEAVMTDVMRL